MTHRASVLLLLVGFLMLIGGLVWLFGAWPLVGAGPVLILLALLVPEREAARGEPADPAAAPPA